MNKVKWIWEEKVNNPEVLCLVKLTIVMLHLCFLTYTLLCSSSQALNYQYKFQTNCIMYYKKCVFLIT